MDTGNDYELTSCRVVSPVYVCLIYVCVTYVEPLGYIFEQRNHLVARMRVQSCGNVLSMTGQNTRLRSSMVLTASRFIEKEYLWASDELGGH